ncbi:pre-peptidase C-terminal domain-containing protein [Leptothoe sp. PORK10 BA2]|uniref:pre-peptidase C-terminal domain-containing protein n=1 Tax=Leptothoe sp. PORK10 BA2 TaxID=3110254 RepID=UPI002B1F7161|nr:pre-peptidase C-terminal domain-containing protein [Leptothoe sp. PORK10 BA2]MEA5464082.1 pre-peptidase C-terminal domain-containing protein [Leptothoe sp. PORK10 BA2]
MSRYDLGILSSRPVSRNGYSVTAFDSTDVFEFDITGNRVIGLYLHGITSGDGADLRLFRDSNHSGILDSGDQQVASSRRSGNANDVIDYSAIPGTYFAQVERYAPGSNDSVFYNLDLSAVYNIGSLNSVPTSQDRYKLGLSDPTDVFEFNLSNDRNINLFLHNISLGDDADLSLYRDSNGNGIFDADDQNVATSRRGGNADDVIDYFATAGTYFAQVERYAPGSQGSVSYDLDLSAVYNVGTLDNTPIKYNQYNLSASDPTDVFEFNLSNSRNLNLSLHNISQGDDADLDLFWDNNNNGIFDSNDQLVASSRRGDNADDVINYNATAGNYFVQVERYAPTSQETVSYDLDIVAGTTLPVPPSTAPTTYRPFDANQVFSLNSNTGADHTIYLDFDGHVTTGTLWNQNYGDRIQTDAYDTDGDTSNFSTSERESIWRIWQRVAEDFSPFDVNVTTALPSTQQLTRNPGNDTQWGIRVAIGGSASDWYGSSAGGVAYLNTFNSSVDTPTFAFSETLGTEKNVAEAISHEVGHTLGLSHDGDATNDYYRGHGSGATGWAPIMGVGYSQELTQWSRGEYRNAGNPQDDLDIITGQNGFGYRTDDHGDQLTDASALAVNGAGVATYGIIETNTDTDWFSFATTSGNISLDINPFERGANLDILAELYDASGQLVIGSNPTNSLSASFNTTLSAGQYYLSVTGTGQGDLLTGYSDYGSLGQYSITGAVA